MSLGSLLIEHGLFCNAKLDCSRCGTRDAPRVSISFNSSILTASHYQRARLSIHGEVSQFHGTLGLDGESSLQNKQISK